MMRREGHLLSTSTDALILMRDSAPLCSQQIFVATVLQKYEYPRKRGKDHVDHVDAQIAGSAHLSISLTDH